MKTPIALLILTSLLAGCKRQSDARVPKGLSGTWVATGNYSSGTIFTSTITFDQNSNYVCRIVTQGASGTTRTSDIAGNFQIRGGMLIDTMTKHSNTNAVLPTSMPTRIARIDDREMVLKWESIEGEHSPTNDVVFRKVEK
jgi:hypothetical protein